MLKNKFFQAIIVVIILSIIGYSFFNSDSTSSVSSYDKQLTKERTDKNTFFRTNEKSPIENRDSFKGLNYFPPNSKLKLNAKILPYEGNDIEAQVPMTDGSVEKYEKYGFVAFEIQNQTYKLLVYRLDKTLSILFKDATAPTDTYGGGRYIDIPLEKVQNGNEVVLDFNSAYNPYCAYNHTYACPLPPKENVLAIRIEAGEKKFE